MTRRRQRAGNLPAEATELVGRAAELAQVRRWFGDARLVTLTGVGGVGKTRLALRAAYEAQPSLRDGTWWVGLSPLRRGALLAHTIAEALPLADQTTRPMIDVVADYLEGRELLLVLDTCEHLIDECAMTVETLLATAPGLRILVTSRRRLDVSAEQLLTVAPLPVPDPRNKTAGEADAVALLAARAAEAAPGFTVTDANRAGLVRLCRRLDGLPLAIELAAARLRDLSVTELTDRLEDRFAVLGETEQAVYEADPPWHQALRTAIGWSHELCSPAERLLWARLSVFAGSFDAVAARRVCADQRLPDHTVLSLLTALVDKSILVWEPTGAGERYRMLDTLREYGAHWLRALGDDEDEQAHRAHLRYYLAMAHHADASWVGPDQLAWHDRLTGEHDNLRAAMEFSLARPDGPHDHSALELGGALWVFWYPCGHPKEGQHYLERALATDTEPSEVRDQALWAYGLAMVAQGDADTAAALARECEAAARQLGDDDAAAHARVIAMCVAGLRGDAARTLSLVQSLLTTQRHEGSPTFALLMGRLGLSHAHNLAGRHTEAVAALEQLRTTCDRHGERWVRAWADIFRSQAELARGRFQAAQLHAQAAAEVKHRLHDPQGSASAIDVLASASCAMGQEQRAAHLLGVAQQIWDTLGRPQAGVPEWIAARQACERQARAALGDRAYQTAFDTGYHTDLDAGITPALNKHNPLAPPSGSNGSTRG
ncbi:ATP-binding protein [Streptomyces sp. NPDC053542]|uniref:ATP-binding protein n=1 Tax=Streptomyces sp. NPDC053542 TaxID=3365710 RepID=UPI0037CDC1EE